MEAAINEFQPFKAPGLDSLYPVLLQKGWNKLKGYYHVMFQACLRNSYVPLAWKEGTGIVLPKPRKESYFEAKSFHMITLTSFQLKWLERLILHHMKIITCKHSFLHRSMDFVQVFLWKLLCMNLYAIEHCLVRKKQALGIFLDIVGALDNVTFHSFAAALRGLGMSKISPPG